MLVRVITCSPTLAGLPSASIASREASALVAVRFGGEPVGAGALVELADQFAGGGEHDRIQAAAPVGLPGGEDLLGEGGEVADMDCVAGRGRSRALRVGRRGGRGMRRLRRGR